MNTNPSLARRALPAVALVTVAGTLVVVLDQPAQSVSGDEGVVTASADGDVLSIDQLSIDELVTTQPPSMSGSDGESDDTTTRSSTPRTTKKTTTTDEPATTVKKSTTTEADSSTCTSYKGPTVSTKWGPVQVKASVAPDGTICSIAVVQSPTGSRSDRINARAVPILNREAMAAQSADVDSVSGATITSRAYEKSLQAILDKAA